MRKTILLGALLLSVGGLAACVEDVAPNGIGPNITGPGAAFTDAARADCEDHGGTVVLGFAGPTCAKPSQDGGKSCEKASDCSGHCMAETMSCSKMVPQFGCFAIVMEDGQQVTTCVD